jgi:1-phosphatidylinositol-4-phosphate 5-kinase
LIELEVINILEVRPDGNTSQGAGISSYLAVHGLHMLHNLDMPSFLTEGSAPPPITSPSHYIKRLSAEKEKRSYESPRSRAVKDDPGRSNGVLTNGFSSGVSLPNGVGHETDSITTGGSSGQPSPLEYISKQNSGIDSDKARMSGRQNLPERLASRDDGYFAIAEGAVEQDGCLETKVKLNGELNGPQEEIVAGEGATISREDTVLQPNTVYTEPDKMSPRLSDASAADYSLKVPSQIHRVSSPPTFQNPPSSNTLVPHPSNRLQHRHTLEVPRVSTSRLSRDAVNGDGTDEVITATGRAPIQNTPTRRRGSMSLVRRTTRSIHSDMHLDEVPQDEDAARWAEMIRQKRASKRKRREEEDDDRVVMGTKVDQNHVNYVTAYNMLTGIRFTVSRTNAKLPRELTDADFTAKHKFSFDV